MPLFAMVVLLGGASLAHAAEPFLEQTDLFEAGKGGYAMYRIPGLVVTPGGALLAYCEARKDSGSDWGHIDILLRRSEDGGKTWTEPRKISEVPAGTPRNPMAVKKGLAKEGQYTVNNPVAISDPANKAVHFLYCIEYARCFYMRSDDDGKTFTKPIDITATFEQFKPEYDWKVLATGPGHGIWLKSGRLLVPVWMSTGTGGHAHRPSCVATIYSDDAGKTWKRGQIIANDPDPLRNPSESAIVELRDGQVLMNIRHESEPRFRAVATSPNGISDWSKPTLHRRLPDPVCMGSMIRIRALQLNDVLFANLDNATDRTRRNLTVRYSCNGGQVWAYSRALEPGPSAYSDLAQGPDGTIYCFYERSPAGAKNPYQSLRLARFNFEWVQKRDSAN